MKIISFHQFFAILLALIVAAPASSQDRLVRETEPLSPAEEQKALHVPEGFEIRLFAAEPLINKPINLATDARGRVWVSSTVEYPYAATKDRWIDGEGSRVRGSRDAIKILEDTDGDGAADKVTDFADGLNIPTGVLPWHKPEHRDGCIAWSIPNIWYFADTTGDGKCDLREVLFGPLGYEKDTHGMCSSFRLGPDGWVYATHGFNNSSHFEADDGSTLDLHSGNVFRFRPDGSRIELWSAGQVNPFGLCFDGRGNLYSADCHSAPVYQLLRGAVYPSFGKPHDGLGFGPTMIEHTHGSTGICGIAWIDRNVWGSDWNDRVLIGNPVNSRVNFDHIEFRGSTPVAIEQPDFVFSDDPWFRPVDLHLADDGALYIADFYNRIIGHYEVPLDHEGRDRERGRIWKVTKKAGVVAPRPAIEMPAIADPIAALEDDSPFRRRSAAAALLADPRAGAVGNLRAALAEVPENDTHLRHSLLLAVRGNLAMPGGFSGLPNDDAEIANIALAVPTVESAKYLAEVQSVDDAQFRAKRLRHLARNAESIEVVRWLSDMPENQSLARQVADVMAIREGLEERGVMTPPNALVVSAERLARDLLDARKKGSASVWQVLKHPEFPGSASPWSMQMRSCTDGREVEVLSSLAKGQKQAEQRTGIIRSREFEAKASLSFWLCGHRGAPTSGAHEKNYVRLVDAATGTEYERAYPPRNDVCTKVVWKAGDYLEKKVRLEIVDGDNGKAFAWLAITRIDAQGVNVSAFREAANSRQALRQLADLLKVQARADLRDRLRPFLPAPPAAAPLEISPSQRAALDTLIAERTASFEKKPGKVAEGGELFKIHCAACHQVSGEGGLIGPQLDGIGSRGVARLSEDILDPNRNVDAHFYITTLTLKDGSIIAGFLLAERGQVLVIVDTAGVEHRVATGQIEKRENAALSLMPAAFGQILNEGQFSDLLAWLLEQR